MQAWALRGSGTGRRLAAVGLAAALAGASAHCGGGPGAPPPPAPAVAAVCGNGTAETGEECDDGNTNNGDACLVTCRRPANWVPGDPHFHSNGCAFRGGPEFLVRLMQTQQLKVGAALVWRDGFEDDAPHFTGRDHPLSTPDMILHYDMEVSGFPAGDTGHLLLLGLDSLQFSGDIRSTPKSGVQVIEWARRQPRAVVGMAHGQFWRDDGRFPGLPVVCCMPWEFAVHAARQRLDFISFERNSLGAYAVDSATFFIWKALQNAGLRVAIAGASDWPCVTHFGTEGPRTPRTDVIVDGQVTYETWLQGIKAGRTAAALGIGNRLNLRVNGTRLGGEVQLASAGEVTVDLETVAGESLRVEILVNGVVAASLPVEPGVQVTQAKVPINRSAWVSARSPYVVTSPVYVLVAGQPVRGAPEDVCYLMRYVDHLTHLVTSGQMELGESRAEALAAYGEARAEYERRFREAGGTSCE